MLQLDCIIIGGGPAGLTGAIYLGRFRRRILVIDAGKSRVCGVTCRPCCPESPRLRSWLCHLARLCRARLQHRLSADRKHP
jgi:flavin-dependent dehydrogenase